MFKKQDILTVLNNLMGRRSLASGTTEDLERYCQKAYDYAWRYYRWTFSLKSATIELDGDGVAWLPVDFDYDGYRVFEGITEIPLEDTLSSTTGSALEFDLTAGRYKLTPAATGSIVYQTIPPTINDTTSVPFPSIMTIALGALVWAKRGENPASVDTQQEWDTFHAELDRHVARAINNKGRRTPVNRHSITGTYTGDVEV